MYRFLDQPVADLDEAHGFLLGAIRSWVACARAGRCLQVDLGRPFVQRGIPAALGDFAMAMAALDRDGLGRLRLSVRGSGRVNHDEARLLALFDAGLAGMPRRLRRIAAGLVSGDASPTLVQAVEQVAVALTGTIFVERDR